MKKIRTRFAPSPTGYLHIGGLRTALFAYLTSKSQKGEFILRIEDTDEKRKVEGSDKKLIEVLKWIGIKIDEGPQLGGEKGPYIQSERRAVYDKYKKELLEKGEAYHCFCTPERLTKMREDLQKKKMPPRYDRRCRDLTVGEVKKKIESGEKYVIRQKIPLSGEVLVFDEIRGEIKFRAEELDDHVLVKVSGMPTYQFASVVDDHLMEISHVTRGEEWIPSFPKNVLLYKSFNWEVPKFIHLPVVLNKEGGKLSKRQGDVSVEDFKEKGYLPVALINFCALLGWHPEGDNEILDLAQIVEKFNHTKINASPAIFDTEKLDYFNGYYIRQMNIDELVGKCKPFLADSLQKTSNEFQKTREYVKKVVSLEQERLKKFSDIGEFTKFFFEDNLVFEESLLIWKKLSLGEVKNNLKKVFELLDKIPEENWTNNSIEDSLISYIKAKEYKVGDYLWPMRVALTGEKASPGPFDVAEVLGKNESLKRIKAILNKGGKNDS